jgi:integrase/recombinase XerD
MPREPWRITRDMFLSEVEVERLLDHVRRRVADAADPVQRRAAFTDRLLIELLIFSGLRNSECCRLRVEDTVVGTGSSSLRVIENPREQRTVHVPAWLSDLIKRYCRDVRPHLVADGIPPDDASQPLFINERGRGYERTALYRRVLRILTAAGLGDRASVQLLRHTYGYLAYKRTGGSLLFVQRQLGHAHPMVTAIYAQFVDESPAALAERVAAADRPRRRPKRTPFSERSKR